MSRSFNSVTLIGNLTRDPDISSTTNGKTFCRFSLALNTSYTSSTGETIEKADFIDVIVWERTAEVVKNYCHKGKQVLVNGRLQQSTWEKDGEKRSKIEVVAHQVMLLGNRADGNQAPDNEVEEISESEVDSSVNNADDDNIDIDAEVPF